MVMSYIVLLVVGVVEGVSVDIGLGGVCILSLFDAVRLDFLRSVDVVALDFDIL